MSVAPLRNFAAHGQGKLRNFAIHCHGKVEFTRPLSRKASESGASGPHFGAPVMVVIYMVLYFLGLLVPCNRLSLVFTIVVLVRLEARFWADASRVLLRLEARRGRLYRKSCCVWSLFGVSCSGLGGRSGHLHR